MQSPVKRTLTFALLGGLLLALGAGLAAAQGSLEILSLRYRTAEQVIPILRPLLEPGGSLTGQGNQLIVRTSARNLADLRSALDAIDRAQRRLTISVRYDAAGTSSRSGVGVGNQGVRIVDSRGGGEVRIDQRVQVLEGGRAVIASGQSRPISQRQVIRTPTGTVVQDTTTMQDISTGFEVVPRIVGRDVILEIAQQREVPGAAGTVQGQRTATTVTAPLGEWVEIGGADTVASRQGTTILSAGQSQSSAARRVFVRVDENPN